ncbi:MAG: hypothetical protein J1G38_07440 [Clostridiales bacterium]|nr:hypothetical protein [Clostridiales bacterium]
MKISTRAITLAATLAALCAVTGFIPYVFFLPVMVAATTLSLGMAAFVGLAFGCISLAYSFIMPTSPVAMAFIEAPYIPIGARILAAVATFGVYKFAQKLFKPTGRGGRIATVAIAAGLGSLFNTAFVVGLLVLVMPDMGIVGSSGAMTMLAYAPFLLVDGAIECPCMAILTPPITLTLEKTVLRDRKRFQPKPIESEKQLDQNGRTTV